MFQPRHYTSNLPAVNAVNDSYLRHTWSVFIHWQVTTRDPCGLMIPRTCENEQRVRLTLWWDWIAGINCATRVLVPNAERLRSCLSEGRRHPRTTTCGETELAKNPGKNTGIVISVAKNTQGNDKLSLFHPVWQIPVMFCHVDTNTAKRPQRIASNVILSWRAEALKFPEGVFEDTFQTHGKEKVTLWDQILDNGK